MADKPVIFFIHGAWHQPAHLEPVIAKLRNKGYEGVCYQNPTSDNPPDVKTTPESPQTQYGLAEDAAFAAKNLTRLVEEEGKLVFVVGHSWGGMIVSEAVDEELSAAKRKQRGLQGGVVGLFYLTAFLVPKGEGLASWKSRERVASKTPWTVYNPESGLLDLHDPGTYFYHDLSPEEQQHWASLTFPMSPAFGKSILNKASYLHYPTTYFFCEQDRAIPLELQRRMVDTANQHTTIREAKCDASHSPFLSQPDLSCEEIVAAVQWSSNTLGRV